MHLILNEENFCHFFPLYTCKDSHKRTSAGGTHTSLTAIFIDCKLGEGGDEWSLKHVPWWNHHFSATSVLCTGYFLTYKEEKKTSSTAGWLNYHLALSFKPKRNKLPVCSASTTLITFLLLKNRGKDLLGPLSELCACQNCDLNVAYSLHPYSQPQLPALC